MIFYTHQLLVGWSFLAIVTSGPIRNPRDVNEQQTAGTTIHFVKPSEVSPKHFKSKF